MSSTDACAKRHRIGHRGVVVARQRIGRGQKRAALFLRLDKALAAGRQRFGQGGKCGQVGPRFQRLGEQDRIVAARTFGQNRGDPAFEVRRRVHLT